MRSFEDKWVWLRTQLEDDAATLEDKAANAVGDQHRNYLLGLIRPLILPYRNWNF